MSRWVRREVNTDEERKIITALITSTRFCREVLPIVDYNFFQTDYSRRVARWVKDYYRKFKEAPKSHIKDIYDTEKKSIKEAEAELIEGFLSSLSDKYKDEEDGKINADYLTEKAIAYFTERNLLVTSEEVKALVGAGKVTEAQKRMGEYRKVARSMSGWVDPFDPEFINKVYESKFLADEDERTDALFRMDGELGNYMGPLEKGWLVAFMGPMKRGKTWWLQELALQAVMNRYRVAFFSLEMRDVGIISRMYNRLTAFGDESQPYVYPCFDCVKNQDGTCRSSKRVNMKGLLLPNGELPPYTPDMNYKPCTVCRGTKEYKMATWFMSVDRPKRSLKRMRTHLKGFDNLYHNYLKVHSFPSFSANIGDLTRALDELEANEEFVPHLILVDSADILAPENVRDHGREQIDETWKTLKGLADKRRCLVGTVSQSTRATLEKRNVKDVDTGEDIRKLAHVDAMWSLNQTEEEKDMGIMRIGTIVHRWRPFSRVRQVTVLQQLSLGQVALDSAF